MSAEKFYTFFGLAMTILSTSLIVFCLMSRKQTKIEISTPLETPLTGPTRYRIITVKYFRIAIRCLQFEYATGDWRYVPKEMDRLYA